jgi:tetratricopeptide (TPR) repeat protein
LSWALIHLGRWGEARHLLEKSLLLWSRNQNAHVACMRWLKLAHMSVEARDCEGALRQCDEACRLYAERRDITVHFAERATRGRAYVGLRDFGQALACFAEITLRIEEERILMDPFAFVLVRLGLGECRLIQGYLSGARQEARRLCDIAEKPPERTYLAHGHRLLAEIAMAEERWDEANEEIAKALEIVRAAEVPLAAWRVHATAAALCDRQGRSSEATSHRRGAAEVIDTIAGTLELTDPLRTTLSAQRPDRVEHDFGAAATMRSNLNH